LVHFLPVQTRLECEIKLRFPTPEDARRAVLATGAIQVRERRLQDDRLVDNAHGMLRQARCVLRVRHEAKRAWLTFKGPPHPSIMKVREELETAIPDPERMLQMLDRLGFQVWFRYQKYREEYSLGDVLVAIDETPVGTFVEIEGDEPGVADVARALGRAPIDYIVESYRALFLRHREEQGLPPADMLFETEG
jgi:adenylate cyclase class 2